MVMLLFIREFYNINSLTLFEDERTFSLVKMYSSFSSIMKSISYYYYFHLFRMEIRHGNIN
jgi:hypothetical protein